MSDPFAEPRGRLFWSDSQRRAIVFILGALVAYLAARQLRNPAYVSDPQPIDPARAGELADRIDPNVADWQTLAALPMIGEKRAREIVAFRERFVAQNPGRLAFTRAEDLYRIKGFGDAMVAHVRPYLIFPRDQIPAAAATTTFSTEDGER